jgi:hypothetical protein
MEHAASAQSGSARGAAGSERQFARQITSERNLACHFKYASRTPPLQKMNVQEMRPVEN